MSEHTHYMCNVCKYVSKYPEDVAEHKREHNHKGGMIKVIMVEV